jgi:rubrerythrin
MAAFLNPFPGLTPDRKLTPRELSRSVRQALAAEEEAIHLYEALADATDHPLAREVLQDVANEEKIHAGEFLRLLSRLLPDEDGRLAEGAAEVDAEEKGADPEPIKAAAADVQPRLTVGSLREGAGS